ncbi:dihydroorotase [Flavobacteriaceae bacterium]|nr:dihydroorotase [Flavobacteriaceae bacterium]
MKSTLIKEALIHDPSSPFHLQRKDLLIENGEFVAIKDHIDSLPEYRVIEYKNLHISQGWMDASVSFGEPGLEERETLVHGCEVAAKSGFTQIGLNLDTEPSGDHQATLNFVINKTQNSTTTVYPIGNLSKFGKAEELAELFDLKNNGAIAFGDYNQPISNDLLMKICLQYAQNFDGLILSFPQNKSIAANGLVNESEESIQLGMKPNPILAETMQISRDLFLLEYTGGKLHIPTISSKESLELIKSAKNRGLNVSCSVAVHHLFMNDSEIASFDSNTKVNPPLRSEQDRKALVQGIKDGSIDFIVTDHRPIDIEHKKVAYNQADYGSIGLESAFGALNSILELSEFLPKITSDVKNRLGLQTSPIDLGQKAEISLFNPEGKSVFSQTDILSTSKNSIFLNKELKGEVYGVINAGKSTLK